MSWKRFPVPAFEYSALRGLSFETPAPISKEEEARIVDAASSGDPSVVGAYPVIPDAALLEKLAFEGDERHMVLCALPTGGAHLLGRSMAWFNQRAYLLDANAADAKVLMDWRTPRTHNTRLGPENGVDLTLPFFYILSGRITLDGCIGNRVMIDAAWSPDGGHGYRVVCACDHGEPNFHDSCFMVSWAA